MTQCAENKRRNPALMSMEFCAIVLSSREHILCREKNPSRVGSRQIIKKISNSFCDLLGNGHFLEE
jgi:hypothetical protein